jgi:lambda repressor-like predicted transcriptional regulator
MNADDVLAQISQLHESGESLAKKSVKKLHPDLMKNALYYYPSWEHALHKSGLDTGRE